MYNIKEMVSDNKKAKFLYFRLNELWYETETGFKFPVPVGDTGDGVFNAEEKALLLMRYIRKHIEFLKAAEAEATVETPPEVTEKCVDCKCGGCEEQN